MKRLKISKKKIKKFLEFLSNPRFLLCFGLAWIITNGWSYILLGVGTFYEIPWMIAVAGAYMSFLWFPFTPEKVITIFLSIGLLKLLFPEDKKTLAVLVKLYKSAKRKHREWKEKRKKAREDN